MQGSIQIVMTGLQGRDEASISVNVLYGIGSNKVKVHELLFETRLAQDLTETMSIEQWALATIATHTDWIKQQLSMQIEQGSKTLICDLPEH